MECLGVRFNYGKDYLRAWFYCVGILVSNLVLIIASFFGYSSLRGNYSMLEVKLQFGSYLIGNSISTLAAISFIVLLCKLHERFIELNSLLRYRFSFILVQIICIVFRCSSVFIRTRNHFLNENMLKMSAIIRKEDSISTIKFIGRLHSSLTNTVDQLNFCYSYQVSPFHR